MNELVNELKQLKHGRAVLLIDGEDLFYFKADKVSVNHTGIYFDSLFFNIDWNLLTRCSEGYSYYDEFTDIIFYFEYK